MERDGFVGHIYMPELLFSSRASEVKFFSYILKYPSTQLPNLYPSRRKSNKKQIENLGYNLFI